MNSRTNKYQLPAPSDDGLLPTPSSQSQFQQSNSGKGRGRGYGNNKPQFLLCGKFGNLMHKFNHRFNVHFTEVIDPAYTSSNTPFAHMSSAHWEDALETDSFVYHNQSVSSSTHQSIPIHLQSPLPSVSPYIPAVYPYMYHSHPLLLHTTLHLLFLICHFPCLHQLFRSQIQMQALLVNLQFFLKPTLCVSHMWCRKIQVGLLILELPIISPIPLWFLKWLLHTLDHVKFL